MLRLIVSILVLLLLIRVMLPVFRAAGRFLKRLFSPELTGGTGAEKKSDYSQLSPYEIEDTDYDELREKDQ